MKLWRSKRERRGRVRRRKIGRAERESFDSKESVVGL